MSFQILKQEKSTLRFLSNCVRLVHEVAKEEFGEDFSKELRITFSRKMYFTLGYCWAQKKRVSYNLAWIVLHKDRPKAVQDLVIHELMHFKDRTHGPEFRAACAKYGASSEDVYGAVTEEYLPPASWVVCIHCGDTQGLLFSTRLSPIEAKEKLTNVVCRSCGREIEYQELSDKAFVRLSNKIRKLRLYNTQTWEVLKGITN